MPANFDESIYDLVPPAQPQPARPPMYRSQYPGRINPHDFELGIRKVQPGATFGHPDGTNAESPSQFLKSHAKTPALPALEDATRGYTLRPKARPAVPRADERPVMGLTSNKNFITSNAVSAVLMEPGLRSGGHGAPPPPLFVDKPDYGKVPVYLKRNKARLAAEKAALDEYTRMREEQSRAGASVMDAAERAALLRHLKSKWASVNAIYQKLPMSTDTEVKRRNKEAMEKELAGIEKDIRTLAAGDAVLVINEA